MDQYGKARRDVYDSFVYVVNRRKEDTLKYFKDYAEKLRAKRSIVSKVGGVI